MFLQKRRIDLPLPETFHMSMHLIFKGFVDFSCEMITFIYHEGMWTLIKQIKLINKRVRNAFFSHAFQKFEDKPTFFLFKKHFLYCEFGL